jgi:hypothetical protein
MTTRRGHPGGCKVCAHVERTRIELLVAGGAGQKAIGTKYGLSKDSVHRHWRDHVPDHRRASLLLGPVPRQALAARVAEENSSVLDNLRIVRAGLYQQYDAALTAGDRQTGALLAGRLHENLRITAGITGELASSPLVSITNNQTNIALLTESQEFLAFRADLIRTLSRFPEARAAVLAEFERIEAEASELPALPALEHQRDDEVVAAA